MSWYSEIEGNIVIPEEALEMIKEIKEWCNEAGEYPVVKKKDGKATIEFNGLYRNLGRIINERFFEVIKKYPETKGWLWITSTDGEYYAGDFEYKDGKLFGNEMGGRRKLKEYKVVGDYVIPVEPKFCVIVEIFGGVIHEITLFEDRDKAEKELKKLKVDAYGSEKKYDKEIKNGMPNEEYYLYELEVEA